MLGFKLLIAYVLVAAFFAVMASRERRPNLTNLQFLVAVVAWPVSVMVVLFTVAAMAFVRTDTGHQRSPAAEVPATN